ncbi:MAG: glycosyltransferase family 2 protein [Phycisphaerae bacterium]
MDAQRITVIVCTVGGRAEALKRCFESLVKQSRRPDEVVLVKGPGAENADDAIEYEGLVVTGVEQLNISAARNAGVDAAGGDILAFIDDDAWAEADWLDKLIGPLEQEKIAAVGGKVLDGRCGDRPVAFLNGIVRLSGRQHDVEPEPQERNAPAGPWYNRVLGCNFAVRRGPLEEVGRFDEYIEFAYDETDLAVRLIQGGWEVAHAPEAVVVHGWASGTHRSSDLDRNWYAEMKNQMYFGLKNRTGFLSACRTIGRGFFRAIGLQLRFRSACKRSLISERQRDRFREDAIEGYRVGVRAGWRAGKRR